ILADDKACEASPVKPPDANMSEQQSAVRTMELITNSLNSADPFLQQLLGGKENNQEEEADLAGAATMDFTEVIGESEPTEVEDSATSLSPAKTAVVEPPPKSPSKVNKSPTLKRPS